MSGAQVSLLPDGRRLHLNHGPMDLIIEAYGTPQAVHLAYARAAARFEGLLEALVAELPDLRSPEALPLRGPVAQAMAQAVAPFRPDFITPMAAVAGAVADAVMAAVAGAGITRAYVNNGGDIALHLTPGQNLTAAIVAKAGWQAGRPDSVTIRYADRVRGIATSGWRGRSFSLGIADAVTVLARTAAMADAAATMIANAVDLPGHQGITRCPADQIKADSDLGARAVTVAVARLAPGDVGRALDAGLAAANTFRGRGLIEGAALFLQGELRTVGAMPLAAVPPLTPETCLG